jgi:phasin family protein
MAQGFNTDDVVRAFSEFRMPGMPDMQAMMDAQRRNIEALSHANKLAMEGAQAIARRNMEILQQSMSEMASAMQAMMAVDGAPADKAAKQAEMMKAAYERAMGNMREIAELIQRSNGEALEVLNKRFAEAMEEVRGMVKPAG